MELLDKSLLVNPLRANYLLLKESLLRLVPLEICSFIIGLVNSLVILPMISGGYDHTLILTNNGKIVTLGSNKLGQLGKDVGNNTITQFESLDDKFSYISAGDFFSAGITTEGIDYPTQHLINSFFFINLLRLL